MPASGSTAYQVRAKALAIFAESASMRADLAETEEYTALTLAAEPGNRMLEGFCMSSHGVALLLAGRGDEAVEPYARGIAVLDGLPHAEPAAFRALWPLFLAARRDRRAQAAVDSANRLGLAAFHLNRGLIGYAEALLAGEKGDRTRARNIAAEADAGFANCLGWLDLARVLAAQAAMADGWGDPHEWLPLARDWLAARGLPVLQVRCEELLRSDRPNPWSDAGVSTREADVLRRVVEGMPNKQIAAELQLSVRTVEKHVESLLRKTGARSRTELAALMARAVPSERRGSKPTT